MQEREGRGVKPRPFFVLKEDVREKNTWRSWTRQSGGVWAAIQYIKNSGVVEAAGMAKLAEAADFGKLECSSGKTGDAKLLKFGDFLQTRLSR